MLQIPELLAPAGDLERLRYAINYGADAVYCSLPEFGMRSAPANFTPEQLAELMKKVFGKPGGHVVPEPPVPAEGTSEKEANAVDDE